MKPTAASRSSTDSDMLDRLARAEERYRDLEASLEVPAVTGNMDRYRTLCREYNDLSPVVNEYRHYVSLINAQQEAALLMSTGDPEMDALAREENERCKTLAEASYERLRLLLMPKDPNDGRNVIVEIRAGAGGEEACLFAADIFRMYCMYCQSAGFSVTVESSNRTELGGYRKIIFTVEGEGAYSRFKFESGVHEVKRVPVTEAQGRIQTSTVTVAVMPEAEDVEVEINPSDIRFEACRSSGAGGQHINKTDSAVRLTHIPSGIVVECQEERSQFQNRDKAMRMLRTRLLDIKRSEQEKSIAGTRRSLIGSADRSERIRVYRFQENLLCDERIKYKSPTLDSFLNGNMAPLIDALIAADTAEKLNGGS